MMEQVCDRADICDSCTGWDVTETKNWRRLKGKNLSGSVELVWDPIEQALAWHVFLALELL